MPAKKAPKVHEFMLNATINIGNYENVQPHIVGYGESPEEAKEDAERQLYEMHKSYSVSEVPKYLQKFEKNRPSGVVEATPLSSSPAAELPRQACSFNPQITVGFDPITHKYEEGWLSGSSFAGMYAEEFDKDMHSARMAAGKEINGEPVTQQQLLDMWKLNAEISTSFGTAIHSGLELYGKYRKLSQAVKGSDVACLSKNPVVKRLVTEFYENFGDDDSYYEPFVADEELKICGFIDKLQVVDREERRVRIQDYKTNYDILKEKKATGAFKGVVSNDSLGNYTLQLSFYAFILKRAGYIVDGMDIYWPDLNEMLNPGDDYVTCWKHFELDYVEEVESEILKIRG